MADKLEDDINRYINLWTDINNEKFTKPLPTFDKEQCIKDLELEIKNSFNDSSVNALKNKLSTYHKVTDRAHHFRDILNVIDNSLLSLRGLKNVLK